ncbi:MAG: sucrase ferredoxin [Nocardioidaceae bacterium]|nr:sucrase ferredoxin [Nocardioidaceae bacterium]
MSDFRCASASQAVAESIIGTASTVRAFLLMEAPGAWGADAFVGARLDPEVQRRLRDLTRSGIRPLLIRGHGRQRSSGTRVFAAYVGPSAPSTAARPWVESAVLTDPRELLDLSLGGLVAGTSTGLAPYDEPLFFVCTHGKHDVCCAERGRPLCRAMHQVAPDDTWEVSHIGGDRFAPNVLVLPHGLYYGRVDPADAADLVDRTRRGELDLEHVRGRSSLPFAAQAAEIFLRRQLGHLDIAPLPLLDHTRTEEETRLVFVVTGARWEVRVRSSAFELRQLTCQAAALSTGPEHHLVGISAV